MKKTTINYGKEKMLYAYPMDYKTLNSIIDTISGKPQTNLKPKTTTYLVEHGFKPKAKKTEYGTTEINIDNLIKWLQKQKSKADYIVVSKDEDCDAEFHSYKIVTETKSQTTQRIKSEKQALVEWEMNVKEEKRKQYEKLKKEFDTTM